MPSASDDITSGYNNATNYLNPYYQGGLADYNQYRNVMNTMGKNLAPYNNAGDNMYNQINQSPQDYYNSMMKGYTTSPYAQQQTNDMMKASTAGASASGMYGSSAYQNDLQNNANQITQADQQQYYNNMMGANDQQLKYLQNLQGQQSAYRQGMSGLADIGYGSAKTMGQYSMLEAEMKAKADAAQQAQWAQAAGGIAGGIAGAFV